MFDRPSPDSLPRDLPFGEAAIYDRVLWDGALDPDQARDLRALARLFDIDADPDASLPRLWAQVRPLLYGLHA